MSAVKGIFMSKRRIFSISFLSVIALLVILGGYWVYQSLFAVNTSIPPEKLARVEKGSIARSVVATGKIEPLSMVDIKSKASGIIKHFYVEVGDRVQRDQLLVELDKETLEAQLKEAEAFLNAAEYRLQEMEAQTKTLQANLRKAGLEAENKDYDFIVAEFRRNQELYEEGLISKSQYDSIEQQMKAAEVTRNALRAFVQIREAELEQNRRTIDRARAEVVQAQAQNERAEENLKYASIRAPIGGIVLTRELEVGDAVSSILQLGSNATLIMVLGDVTELFVKGRIDETDIGLVSEGQEARITVDAYKDKVFPGRVFRIAPMGVESDNVTRFEVRTSIEDRLELIKVNMSANAEIVLEEHHDVLLIPESAIIYKQNRETFVEVPDASSRTGRREVAVQTGLSNGARTELLSGLSLDDEIIIQ